MAQKQNQLQNINKKAKINPRDRLFSLSSMSSHANKEAEQQSSSTTRRERNRKDTKRAPNGIDKKHKKSLNVGKGSKKKGKSGRRNHGVEEMPNMDGLNMNHEEASDDDMGEGSVGDSPGRGGFEVGADEDSDSGAE